MKKRVILLAGLMIMLLSGCGNKAAEAQLSEGLSNVQDMEQTGQEQEAGEQVDEEDGTADETVDFVINVSKEIRYNGDGSISSWKEYEYEYDSNGKNIGRKCTTYNGDGSISSWEEYVYDSDGRSSSTVVYNGDGSIRSRTENIYDSDDRLLSSTVYDSDGNIVSQEKNEYNSNGDKVKWTSISSFDFDFICEYEYNSDGKLIKQLQYNLDGTLDCWSEYEYDGNGRSVKTTTYNSDGTLRSWDEREFNEIGNILKCTFYFDDGRVATWYEYEYNDIGQPIQYALYYPRNNGEVYIDNLARYDYDSGGRQIRVTHYDDYGNVKSSEEYEYGENGRTKLTRYNGDGSIDYWYEYEYIVYNFN